MQQSLITRLRTARLFMRTISGTVLIAFTMLILTPTVVAARSEEAGEPQQTPVAAGGEAELSSALQTLERKMARLQAKLAKKLDALSEVEDIKALHRRIEKLDKKIARQFSEIEAFLIEKNLPPVILQRHRETVEAYRAELARLLQSLEAVETAADEEERELQVEQALSGLKRKKHRRGHQPFDPAELPNRTLEPDPDNKPKTRPEEFLHTGLFTTPYPRLAALGNFTFDRLAGASDPAYLAASDEIVLSQPIRDQAQALNHDPVKIYHWVRNHIEWLPSWGAIQNAELTLSARRGNAMDIASLTIALLRASGIPARYVHGTIDVPVERFKNWAGGFNNARAAIDYAASAGIPVTALVSGGRIVKVRMEHIWVEAAIDYFPSRGAVNRDADSWVALDPSYKQYDYLTGLDPVQISGIDPQALVQSFIASGTVNEAEGWVTGFDPQILQSAQTQARQKLEQYISANLTNPTVGDVIGGRRTIVEEYPVLPSGLPNPIVVTGARYDKLPASLQQRIGWAFARDVLGDPVDMIEFPMAMVNNEKITLSFRPAAAADRQALEALLPQGQITDLSQLPASIPSYLINVVPELKVNGLVVKTGAPMKLGEELDFITQVKFPHRTHPPRTYKVIAGSYLSVNAIAQSISPEKLTQLQTRLEQTRQKLQSNDPAQLQGLTREALLGDLFHAGTLGYYAQLIAFSYLNGVQNQAHFHLAAGIGTVGYEPKVRYFFGIPRSIEPGGVALDIPFIQVTQSGDGDPERLKLFNLQIGVLSSALEHITPEQMFTTDPANPPEAISAVKALQKASAQGQRIYQITQANAGSILPNIHHDPDTMAEIRNAVSVPGWTGAGYVILDPETNVGAWKIGGGANGGFQTLQDFLLFLIAGVLGYSDAATVQFLGQDYIFSDRLRYLSKLGKASQYVGYAALILSILSVYKSNSLNFYQKIGQISTTLLGFGITSYLISAIVLAAGSGGLAILLGVTVALSLSVIMTTINALYFSALNSYFYRRKKYA